MDAIFRRILRVWCGMKVIANHSIVAASNVDGAIDRVVAVRAVLGIAMPIEHTLLYLCTVVMRAASRIVLDDDFAIHDIGICARAATCPAD